MYGDEDHGIVDQSAVAMRVATIAAGIWLSYVVCGASAVYVADSAAAAGSPRQWPNRAKPARAPKTNRR